MSAMDDRALTLKIDAPTPEDMVVLLRQALYEIEKNLPAPSDGPVREKNKHTVDQFIRGRTGEIATTGHSEGTLGSYHFELLYASRAFKALEDDLFRQGYQKENVSQGWTDNYIYKHLTLPPKKIAGDPLTVQDADASTSGSGVPF